MLSHSLIADSDIFHVKRPRAGEYLFIVSDDTADVAATAEELTKQFGGGGKVRGVLSHGLRKGFGVEKLTAAAAAALSRDPRIIGATEVPEPTPPQAVQSPAPSWGLDRIDQRAPPLDNAFYYWYDGAPVTVYVVDTGVNRIPDFASRIVGNVNFALRNGVLGTDASDCYNHGTLTADLAVGTTYGVAKQAHVVNVRVFGCTVEESSALDYVSGLDWVINDHITRGGPAIVLFEAPLNAIWQPLDDAARSILNARMTLVIPAGNKSQDACTWSPARLGGTYDGIITVGSSSWAEDSVSQFSNYGTCVDLFAPGEAITMFDMNGTVVSANGTSLAAPIVVGVVAAFDQQIPGNPADLESLIIANATFGALTHVPPVTHNLLLFNYIAVKKRACCVY